MATPITTNLRPSTEAAFAAASSALTVMQRALNAQLDGYDSAKSNAGGAGSTPVYNYAAATQAAFVVTRANLTAALVTIDALETSLIAAST